MKIVIISGSSRKGSQSIKISNWLANQLKQNSVEVEILDLYQHALPLQHEDVWADVMGEPAQKLQAILEPSDGFVVVSAEWSGMVPPALKNFFLYVDKSMANKPAYLVGVSATGGGRYPIAELRMSSYKNTRLVNLPEHLVIEGVNELFNSDGLEAEDEKDKYLRARADYGLKVLVEYTKALKQVRDSNVSDFATYPFGM